MVILDLYGVLIHASVVFFTDPNYYSYWPQHSIKIQALTRQFEEKYGGASEKIRQKKKTRNKDDYADLGFGYDSDDPFIG